jgi:hypothetical protein
VIYYGKNEVLPDHVELNAGPLTLLYEQGGLRSIVSGDTEILRRIYVAIRDRNWCTVMPVFSNLRMDVSRDSFLINFDATNQQDEIAFTWTGIIRGDADGAISFKMSGEALTTFWRNRIGFCVLYPAFLSGYSCEIQHQDGRVEKAHFPVDISPSQPVLPFVDLKKISYKARADMRAEVEFRGDIFEMEDQRNWTDASYKIYCTPLHLAFPVRIQAGTKVSQSIILRLFQQQGKLHQRTAKSYSLSHDGPKIHVDRTANEIPLPHLGLGISSNGLPLSSGEMTRLRCMHLHHIRVDLRLSDPAYSKNLESVTRQATELDLKLEVALLISSQKTKELEKLRSILNKVHPSVCSWLCYVDKEWLVKGISSSDVLNMARAYLTDYDPTIPFCGGTNSDFIFLEKGLPTTDQVQKICFAITPQVHSFDNESLVETLEVQGAAVNSARHLSKGLPVIVSPITLKPRFNPYATEDIPADLIDGLPPQVDARQMSLFGAGWTLGSFKYLAEAGTDSVTYFETKGWQGVMETLEGSRQPDSFYSLPGCVFPLYHVLADIGDFKGGSVLPIHSNRPLLVNGLLLRKEGHERIILANYSAASHKVGLNNMFHVHTVRRLDETNIMQAMRSPMEYRHAVETPTEVNAESMEINLLPFGLITIDS